MSQNIVYQITKKVEVIKGGKYGTSYIFLLINIENTKVKVRSSKLLISELQRKRSIRYSVHDILKRGVVRRNEIDQSVRFSFKKGEKIISLFTSSTLTSTSTSTSPPLQKNE